MLKSLCMAAAALAISSGAARAAPDRVITLQEDARAPSASTFTATCGAMTLRLEAAYGDSAANGRPVQATATLNGRPLGLEPGGLAGRLGQHDRTYKYSPACAHDKSRLTVRYYSIHRENSHVVFRVGRFNLTPEGALTFDSEETVSAADFFFG